MRIRPSWHPALLLTAVAFAAGGCDRHAPLAPTNDNVAALDASLVPIEQGENVPFRWSGSGVFVSQNFAPDFGPPTFGTSDFDGRCSGPADYVARFTVTGEATHLGSLSAALEHCGYIDWQTGLTTDRDGLMVITAANGDELRGSYEDQGGGGHFTGSIAFIGGTGRFAGATGHGTFSGTTDRSQGTVPSFAMEGVIAYEASDAAE
jgi:hypothetical protein